MKWFLLLLMATAAGAIFYFRDEIRGKVGDGLSTDPDKSGEVTNTGSGSSSDKTATGNKPPRKKTTTGTESKPPIKPIAPRNAVGGDDELAKRYPMPKFKSIDEAVGNWNAVPSTAFPRPITLKAPVKVELAGGVGSSTWQTGSQAFALRADGNILTVGKTRDAIKGGLRGQIGIDNTDYKEVLTKEFNNWKKRQEAIVMKKRARHRGIMAQAKATAGQTPSRNEAGQLEYEKELGKKPVQHSDGSVPVMLASLRRKDVNEITPDIIEGWGPVVREVVEGKAYWTATVNYETVSMFGEIPTEAQALMRNEKVIRWIYTGSGESVP